MGFNLKAGAMEAAKCWAGLDWDVSSRGRGRLRGFLELRRPWGFSPEAW